ncbi:MAG: hypothetical protein KDK39_04005 [Leptospiraceae bacterium]|nr:hypothetical protein [Leptospiraceae bacterium]
MILFILYTGAGLYLLLIAVGWIHQTLFEHRDPYTRSNMRMAMTLFGIGLFILGLYYGYVYLLVRPALQDLERRQLEELRQKPDPAPPSADAN